MQAIRSVNAAARLIQTEDLGKTYSTPLLAYQADFENIRRLLTFDILSGRFQAGHPQYHHMLACGIPAEELAFFEYQFCVPDVIGVNYYITSERWLDENVENFDPQTHGGNGVHCYADTEMVRANPAERGGFKVLAADIWHRYSIPLAVTELHLHCTREEQLRWFKEIWDDAKSLTEEGITIEGVTAWALLGSFDWDTLLTKTGSQYESGVFDIKTIPGRLRPTAIASLIKMLVRKGQFLHPILPHKGWWHGLSDRTVDTAQPVMIIVNCGHQSADRMFESAALYTQLQAACNQRGILYKIIQGSGNAEIEQLQPWAIVQLFCPNSQFDPSLTIQSYVKFDLAHADRICVNICVQHRQLTIHQINKILDLLIDGEEGAWIFGSNDLIFKSDTDVPDWIFAKQVGKEFELIQ